MQSRCMSLAEAVTNVLLGYGIAMMTQVTVFPFFGLVATLGDDLLLGIIFTGVSLVRSYALRRMFNTLKSNA